MTDQITDPEVLDNLPRNSIVIHRPDHQVWQKRFSNAWGGLGLIDDDYDAEDVLRDGPVELRYWPGEAPANMTPPRPITPESMRAHLGTLIDDPFGVSARKPDYPGYIAKPLMLRDGDSLIPVVQAGVHDGHVFVETWESFGRRLERGDNH